MAFITGQCRSAEAFEQRRQIHSLFVRNCIIRARHDLAGSHRGGVFGERLRLEAPDATTEPSAAAEDHFTQRERTGRDWPYSAVKLVDDLAGASPASASFPVGTVVISDDGAGDQTVGSSEVNGPRWLDANLVSSDRRASKATGRSASEP